MMSPSESARGEPGESEEGRMPFGAHLLALIAGMVIAILGWKSAAADFRLLRKFTHFDAAYRPVPAKFLRVEVRRDTAGGENEYYPNVLFEFFVDGKSVWGWRFSYEEEPRPRAFWEERLRGFHPGDTVTAYVNPADPKDSLVEKKRDGNLFRLILKILMGSGFFLAGAALLLTPPWIWAGKLFKRRSAP